MKPIYLESDEEITSVIDKISAAGDGSLALVVAKNSPIAQSLVNLKLIAKESEAQKKDVCLITNNRVSLKLAGQVGLKAYSSLGAVGSITSKPIEKPVEKIEENKTETETDDEERLPDGTVVKQYRPDRPTSTEKTEEPKDEIVPVPEEKEEIEVAPEPVEAIVEVEEPKKEIEELPEVKEVKPPVIREEKEVEPDLPPVVGRTISISPTVRREFHFPWKSAIIAIVLILIAGIVSAIFLPRATVTATFPATYKETTLSLSVKTIDDSAPTTILGNLLTSNKTATKAITATGKKDIGTKASGTITLFNKDSSSSISLSAGATLTSSGKSFTLDKATTIPGSSVSGGNIVPGQTSAAITAYAAGTDSNLSNVQFAITGKPALVYGSGSTSGGSTKQVTVLSQEDVDKAINELKTQVKTEAQTEMQEKSQGQTVLDGSIWESSIKEEVDKAVGAQVDSATATATYELSAIAFDANTAVQKLTEKLSEGLTSEQEFQLNPDVAPITVYKSYSSDHLVMTIEVSGSGFVVAKINKVTIANEIKNKSVNEAKQKIINSYQATGVEISIKPNWWFGRLPLIKGSINIEFGFDATGVTE